MTILILDDEKTIRKAISFALRRNGHQVIEAYNPKAALEKIDEQLPDLIIMDLELPVMSGLDFLKILEKKERKIPVVVLTSLRMTDSDLNEYQISPQQIISKESTVPEILEVIEKMLKLA